MSKRLAITISGAVSLGSYEAGVLYEIINAIGQHNTNPATPENEKIFVDVLTGASAGGMTATIAAQKLLFESGALAGAYTNSFYLPWVADVNLDGLFALHGSDDAVKSVFSSEFVIDISKRYLTSRYLSHRDPVRQRHPAGARNIQLGLAMANLNGVDYGLPLRPSGQFVYTRHQDELKVGFDADDPLDDVLDFWEPIRNAAVSCGAFPFAFRVIDVIRHATEYADPAPITPVAPTQSFAYTDGGTFQNEPLGLAKDLVDAIDKHLDVDNRFYLFVAPGSKSSTANADFNAAKANFRNTGLRLVSSIFDQARFHDWIMAESVNAQVDLFNRRASELRILVNNAPPETIASLQRVADTILPPLFATAAASESIEAARVRLRAQFESEYNSLSAEKRDTWIDAILTLEKAASLATRDEMTIYGITADDTELASFEFFAFAGFFDRRYREHDYDVGRTKAREFLAKETKLGPIQYNPGQEPIRAIDHSLDGLRLEQMDRAVREQVCDRLRNRAHEILKEAGVNPWLVGGAVREAIDLALIKPQIEKLLKL